MNRLEHLEQRNAKLAAKVGELVAERALLAREAELQVQEAEDRARERIAELRVANTWQCCEVRRNALRMARAAAEALREGE